MVTAVAGMAALVFSLWFLFVRWDAHLGLFFGGNYMVGLRSPPAILSAWGCLASVPAMCLSRKITTSGSMIRKASVLSTQLNIKGARRNQRYEDDVISRLLFMAKKPG